MIRAYEEQFVELAAEGDDAPAWLAPIRRAAMERFKALGFPTTRDEDWHYTSVAPISEGDFAVRPRIGGAVGPADLSPFLFDRGDWPAIVFVNGTFAPELSSLGGLPAGVRVVDLARAWREMPDVVEAHLTRVVDLERVAFTALNTAFLRDAAVIHVGSEMVADAPVHIVHVADANAAKTMLVPRTLIVAERHARLTVVESFVAIGEARYCTNAVTEVVVGDGATINHYKIQRESPRALHVGTTQARQGRDSHYVSFSFSTGGALTRTNIHTELAGEGAGATLNGLFIVDGDQHVDHQTLIDHAQPNCFSRELYKGILDGASRGVFNGKVYVHPVAQKTDGKQENHALLLSEKARMDSKPQLEIFADDVKCTHGATVGRIDETALFYMLSRGIDRRSARELLTYAFAAEVIEQLELPPVRDGLEALTLRRFRTSPETEAALSA
ncbi:MAG TPA: Fe-S cluster assembly protein SufD [Gemmatimonadaceae bacterium]|nr:Fe-S cluster assembly protein SufD [Gemmatimonadaceae bacterium]